MSWIQKLYETYENCQSIIGDCSSENEALLLPICHTTQMAQIEIVIDMNGNFKRAKVISKDNARTIVPCTESSGGRSGKSPVNHPLCDKLQYIAKDFIEYGGEVTIGYRKDPKEPYEIYINSLRKWCESEFSHPSVEAILKYTEKGTVIKDLINNKVLHVDQNTMKLIKMRPPKQKDSKSNDFSIFDLLPGKENKKGEIENWQALAFVRWIVETPNSPHAAVHTDLSIFNSWIKYYESTKVKKQFCHVTGKQIPLAEQHPAKVRNDGDKAKLISSNDTSGFTFRGRFLTSDQACGVGFEVTQKAHNALRWLIGRQGYKRGDLAIVAWSTVGKEIPDPMSDAYSLLGVDLLPSDSGTLTSTSQELALKLNKKIAGYASNLGKTVDIVVLGLDSATPGRMAICFYRELTGSDFIERINRWHESCSWIHDYRQKEIIDSKTGKKKKIHVKFVGAPAPNDIAEAAYSKNIDDKLRKSAVTRIFPCIIDGQRIPRDLVESVVRRASNRHSMENWEWNKTLSIACALYRKYYEKEEFGMALDENRRTREYLYGRLLALAESLEQWALNKSGEKRQTNAERLMQRFADHPYTTWRNIELALSPYKARLAGKSAKRQQIISEVIAMFETDDFKNDKRMSGEFLLGYHCQREALWKKNDDEKEQVSDGT